MSNEAANVAILEDAYRRWRETRGGSVAHFMSIADPDISFGSISRGAEPLTFAKRYNNKKALQAYFEGLLAEWAMVDYTVHEFVAQGDAVVMRAACAWTNKATGKTAETPKLDF